MGDALKESKCRAQKRILGFTKTSLWEVSLWLKMRIRNAR